MTLSPSATPQWEILDLDMQPEQEYELFDSVVSEFNDIGGFPILYYVKLNTNDFNKVDKLYGEDPNEEFSTGYRSKIIYKPSEEPDIILDVFGMTSDETLQYVQITKTLFLRDIEKKYIQDYPQISEHFPTPGDVIRILWDNRLYEISTATSKQNVFQAKKLVWEFILRPYRHSEESESADDMLFYDPDESDFPDINETTTTKQLSDFGDNDFITQEASGTGDIDSSIYGY